MTVRYSLIQKGKAQYGDILGFLKMVMVKWIDQKLYANTAMHSIKHKVGQAICYTICRVNIKILLLLSLHQHQVNQLYFKPLPSLPAMDQHRKNQQVVLTSEYQNFLKFSIF